MRVRVTRQFPWAPDGNHVRTVKAGEVLEGRGAEVALQMHSGEVLEAPPVDVVANEPGPVETPTQPAATPHQRPPKHRGR